MLILMRYVLLDEVLIGCVVVMVWMEILDGCVGWKYCLKILNRSVELVCLRITNIIFAFNSENCIKCIGSEAVYAAFLKKTCTCKPDEFFVGLT